ncbi:MAG: hypothetical protein J6U66_01755, partial [Lachnospiraceae bacterium]|nr:hypothetical protein [Lachnospiraceae bacterium]
MTKQNYAEPNMEIVVIEDVIKTSGGFSNNTCAPNSVICSGGDTGFGCNPDTICNDTGTGCNSYFVCTSEWSP